MAGRGVFARRERAGWEAEVETVLAVVAGLDPCRTLDVACGTGFVTRHLRGDVTGLDQSATMVAIAAAGRLGGGRAVQGDAVPLPFADDAFDRVFTANFYGHLLAAERAPFLAEARRVAPSLVVLDAALHPGGAAEEWQERQLNDGSRHRCTSASSRRRAWPTRSATAGCSTPGTGSSSSPHRRFARDDLDGHRRPRTRSSTPPGPSCARRRRRTRSR